MTPTTLKIDFSEALPSGLSCAMSKTLAMPYPLRLGDSLCEGDPCSDEAFDFVVASTWYELQTSTLVVLLEGDHQLPVGSVESMRQALFALGWMQELPLPRLAESPVDAPPIRLGQSPAQVNVFPPACPRCTQRPDQCICPCLFPDTTPF